MNSGEDADAKNKENPHLMTEIMDTVVTDSLSLHLHLKLNLS